MYYKLELSSEPEKIGVKNGWYQVEYDADCFSSKEEYKKFSNFFDYPPYFNKVDKFTDVNINIEKLNVLTGAKLTDFIGYTPYIPYTKFLVNQKVLKIINCINSQKHLVFNTTLYKKGKIITSDFSFFYCPEYSYDKFIIEKCQLYTRQVSYDTNQGKLVSNKEFYDIKSRQDFNDLSKQLSTPNFSKICLTKDLIGLDIIFLEGGLIFISDKLKRMFEESQVTGIETGSDCEITFER